MDKRLSGSALRGKRLRKYKPSYHTYQGLLLSEAQVVVKPQVTKADRQRYGKGFVAFSCVPTASTTWSSLWTVGCCTPFARAARDVSAR